ncbi:DUF7529 family protein [Natronomonas sp. EA1]|uniref:DUF7529 family protein n=1 Tax=Natronomonas sp. EA1 TaxID=3421655 RepID=UPI003EBC32A0
MVEIGEEDLGYADRIAANADVLKSAWEGTIADMNALAEEYEQEGWDTFTVAAGDVGPENPSSGQEGRWGLVHVIPNNFAEGFEAAFSKGAFPEYDVFRQEADGNVFHVIVLRDPDSKTAIFLAGQYELMFAGPLVRTAKKEGEMYTHVQLLDETHIASFRHSDPEKFFPHYEEFDDYVDYDPISDEE